LPLHDPGFDSSVLCEFRARLLAGGRETLLLVVDLSTAALFARAILGGML